MATSRFTYLLVGGGLQNALIALALRERRPEATIALVEQGPTVGGNHAWSFHESDVPAAIRPLIEALTEHRWPGYEVHFPGFSRHLDLPYATFTSTRLDRALRDAFAAAPSCRLLLGRRAESWDAHQVALDGGERLEGEVVIVARGPEHLPAAGGSGFLKFYGLELRLEQPVAPTTPVVMDATCAQRDGFRFFYLLPLAPDLVLLEDNYFSTTATLDGAGLREAVLVEAAKRGLVHRAIERQEWGVLPMPWRPQPPPPDDGPLVAGYQGGWFHPATSYSLPIVARFADLVAATAPAQLRGPALARLTADQARQAAFAHRLNWLLFRTSPVANRWRIMSAFYRHPPATLQRFYSLQLTAGDRFRILRLGAAAWSGAWLLPQTHPHSDGE